MEAHVRELLELIGRLERGERLLGIDPGEKNIGLALSDVSLTIASPLETLRRGKFQADVAKFEALVAEHGVGGLIIGLPLRMGGSVGSRAQAARSFANRLGRALKIPFLLWDERFSTRAVGYVLRDAGGSTKRRGELVDKLAAAHILQGVLDCAKAASRQDSLK